MSDTNTPNPAPTPTVDNGVPPGSAPEPDPSKAGTDDVPASDKSEDIRRDLGTSPELKTAQDIQKRLESVSDAYKKALEDAQTIDPGNVEAIEKNKQLQQDLIEEGKKLSEEFSKLSSAANANAGKRLGAPGLEQAASAIYEKIIQLLKALLDMFKGGLRKMGILESPGKGPDGKAGEGKAGEGNKPVTAQDVDNAFNGAIEQGGNRLNSINAANAKAQAMAENSNDAGGPGVKPPKP
jgi:hypothetical protein